MLQLKNTSPFEPAIAVFPNKDGVDTAYVIIRGTFQINHATTVAEEQLPPVMADEYWGEPGSSSLKYMSDMHLGKPATDVVFVGRAWAPGGQKVQQIDVAASVADRQKTVRVFGNRQWRGGMLSPSISPPEPFESMPITYEQAFGGIHEVDPEKQQTLAEDRNPVGVGFRGKRKAKEMVDTPLPNIEDPQQLIRSVKDQPPPAGFGFIAASWEPRRSFAGTYDEAWQKSRAPYLPTDFNPRFFNAAHPDLTFDRFLQGGEPVHIENASRRGPLSFNLPRCTLDIKVKVAGQTQQPPTNLETVLIEPEEDRLSLVWRTSVPCDKKVLKVEEVVVGLESMRLD